MFPSSTHLVPHSYDLELSFTPLGPQVQRSHKGSCQETSYRDLVPGGLAKRPLIEFLCRDLARRPLLEILYKDLVKRAEVLLRDHF